MKGKPPLVLFTTMARDPRLFAKYFGGGLLDRGHLTPRQREIVIDRVTARCGAEYEWGVHVAQFAGWAGLDREHIASLTHGSPDDACWDGADQALIEFCDALHETATIGDDVWSRMRSHFDDAAMLELLLLAGFYRTTSYLVNALQLPLEPGAARFADYE